jgi:hypothetical protein
MRFRRSTLGIALLATTMLAQTASAVVVCQKGNRVKLRAATCTPKETAVATLGGGGEIAGTWEFTGGSLLSYSFLPLQYLVLNADGTGRMHLSGGDGPVVACVPLNWSRDPNGTLVVDDWGMVSNTRVYRFAALGDELELTDAVGQNATFDRATAVDPSDDCGTLVQSTRFDGLPRPDNNAGLVFDGTELLYKEDDEDRVVPVDPGTGVAGTPLGLSPPYIYAAQGADFWVSCHCGGSEEALRITRAGLEVDAVDTILELGDEIGVEAIAYDAAGAVLWLHGFNDDNQGRLLKVDPAGEPDVLLAGYDLDADIRSLAVSGNELWGLNTFMQSVIRIDAATGHVTGTFLIPDRSAQWTGIAAIGDQLFLIGQTQSQGALLVVAKPS